MPAGLTDCSKRTEARPLGSSCNGTAKLEDFDTRQRKFGHIISGQSFPSLVQSEGDGLKSQTVWFFGSWKEDWDGLSCTSLD